ncbi:MAG: ECF transporter S component [Candidatus Eremiobacteraeota bacterium]|nr:ECF transporter S component [Candidatus Eremiobacteraeota bacterium]
MNTRPRNILKVMATNGLLIALVAIVTATVRIATPLTGGYINLGDVLVLACGYLLGGPRGALVGGLGSAFADLSGGHFIFVPGTLVIKGLEGFCAGMLGRDLNRCNSHLFRLAGGFCGASAMVGGYFLYEQLIMGYYKALSAVIPNAIQGIIGMAGSLLLYPLLEKAFHQVTQKASP